jgi:hypothetical protein
VLAALPGNAAICRAGLLVVANLGAAHTGPVHALVLNRAGLGVVA